MFDRKSRKAEIKIARPAQRIDPAVVLAVSLSLPQCVRRTQVCQVPISAQADSQQVTAIAEARATARGRAREQVAHGECGMQAARVAAEVEKVAVRGRHVCGGLLRRAQR